MNITQIFTFSLFWETLQSSYSIVKKKIKRVIDISYRSKIFYLYSRGLTFDKLRSLTNIRKIKVLVLKKVGYRYPTWTPLLEIIMHYKSTFKIWQYKNRLKKSTCLLNAFIIFHCIIISYNCPTRKYDYLECQLINNYDKFQGSDVYCHVTSLCRLLSENNYDNWMALTSLIYLFFDRHDIKW